MGRPARPSRHIRNGLGVALVAALAACAAATPGGGRASSARGPLTREEIGERRGLDVYEIVRQLRPGWLQLRGQSTPGGGVRRVQVVIDDSLQPGGVETLRTLRGSQVQEVRFLSGQDATTRYGLDVEAGVIVVTTDRGRSAPVP